MTKKFLLKYSTERADKPIFASVIRKTDAPINILHADLTTKGGEILVAIDAPDEKVREIEELFRGQGLEVEEIKRVIQLDEEACIDCGACVSLCPTEALRLTGDYSLELDEDKCVYCEACVPACPVRALKVRKL